MYSYKYMYFDDLIIIILAMQQPSHACMGFVVITIANPFISGYLAYKEINF